MGYLDFGPYRFVKGARMGALPADREPTHDELRLNACVKGIQVRLKAQDFDPRRTDGVFGYWTGRAVVAFQKDRGIKPADGAMAGTELRELFRALVHRRAVFYEVSELHLAGVIAAESGFDPAADGAFTDPARGMDRGLVQINSQSHPDVSDKEAYNPAFSIDWLGQSMLKRFEKLVATAPPATHTLDPWDIAALGHHAPVGAAAAWETGELTENDTTYIGRVRTLGATYLEGDA